jgi:DNA polymerase-3 subunit alpha
LVAYALTITDLDPIRFGLLFERFSIRTRFNARFDIDFCQEKRDEVIAYVRRRYGGDKVAQIITFGSFLARGVMRNAGRVLKCLARSTDWQAGAAESGGAGEPETSHRIRAAPQRSRRD